ncbi:helix-turn-helix transcriptional regulator [Herbidospora daliensis]|uniref:helix-turn-helix transcriptional regulator n=1 Tax=Herbidospora daliensis TaxID=295585 RepID=UPI0007814DFA|nr:helix-turn-helix transcriptional regulator [Herbidospora daliensis]
MDRSHETADFLRGRRARLRPDAAGLPGDGRIRRVPGLRRDEVARLAGVSVEYYTRLEQGRGGNPSPEVVAALAEALRLDPAEREHLADLLGRTPAPTPATPQRVRSGLHLMLRNLDRVPAYVMGRRTDVLASNRLARAVIGDFDALPVPHRNIARISFLDPQARERLVDWEQCALETVATLRLEAGRNPGDRRLADLIRELTLRSPEFARWWDDHRVFRRTHGTKRFRHPIAGDLEFFYENLRSPDDPDQSLCVFNVEPGSPTERNLRLLA